MSGVQTERLLTQRPSQYSWRDPYSEARQKCGGRLPRRAGATIHILARDSKCAFVQRLINMASSLAEQQDAASAREQLAAQLCRAMFDGDMQRAQNALQQGADPNLANREGHLPLWLCCGRGHADLARLLLEHNANVNASRPYLGMGKSAATMNTVTKALALAAVGTSGHHACR